MIADPLSLAVAAPGVLLNPIRLVPPAEWAGHIPFAFWLTAAVRPRVFVELGTTDGVSYSAFAQGIQIGGLQTACYGIGPGLDGGATPPLAGATHDDWVAFHLAQFNGFSQLLQQDPLGAAARFSEASVDLLHLQRIGPENAVRRTLDAWLPKLSERGVLIMTGISELGANQGVTSVWPTLAHQYRRFTFKHAGGLGVAAVGTVVPPDLEWLLDLAEHSAPAAAVRRCFAALGERLELRLQLDQWRKASASASAAKQDAMAAVKERQAAIEALESRLQAAESAAAEAAAIADRERRAWAEQIADAERRYAGVVSDLGSTRDELQRVEASVAALERDRRRGDERIRELESQTAITQAERTRLLDTLDRLFADFEASEQQRRELEAGFIGFQPSADASLPGASSRVVPARFAWRARLLTWVVAHRRYWGMLRRLQSSRGRGETRRIALALIGSELFDARHYAGVTGLNLPPIVLAWHYEVFGRFLGTDPHPLFDTKWYLAANPDVAASGCNPLLHYATTGYRERRDPHPLFSVAHYLNTYRDVAEANLEPLGHFLIYGGREGRDPHPYFDTWFYLRRYPDVRRSGVNPLLHYVTHGAAEGRDPSPSFSTATYLARYPDVARSGIAPLTHYATCGLAEQRTPAAPPPPPLTGMSLRRRPSVAVYVSSLGNYFFQEIASVLVAGFEDLDFPVELRFEADGVGGQDLHVALAPHELFTLGEGRRLMHLLPLERTILYNTEQPKSRWFGPVRGLLGRTVATWDLDYSSSRLIQADGFPCRYVPLGYSPRLRQLVDSTALPLHYGTCTLPAEWLAASAAGLPWRERPIDVLFVGHLSERRSAIFGELAPTLAQLRCMLHFGDVSRPIIPGVTSYMDTKTAIGLAQRAKIVLNLHHGHGIYFEWHRIVMHGILQGALVLTEPAAFAPPLEVGRHYFVSPVRQLAEQLSGLLLTEAGRERAERVARDGFEALTSSCRIADYLAEAVAEVMRSVEATR
jgi:hypothetical protein